MIKLERVKKFNISKIKRVIDKKNKNYNFFLFIIGMVLNALAINIFYFPNKIVSGDVSGISIIISNYLDVDFALLILIISSILLIISFLIFGLKNELKSVYGTFLFPIFVKASTLIVDMIDLKNTSLFLLIICGGILSGLGFGLIKKSGYNLGGLHYIYDLIHEKFKISIGTVNLICNIVIVIASAFVFDPIKAVYAAIGLYINSYVSDRVVLGISRNKAFYIVTKKSSEVKEYLVNELNYKITVIDAKGGYSEKKKELLLCVIPTMEYVKIKEVIKEIDKDAFFLITDSYSLSNR